MPQTNEVLKFTELIGPFYEFVDERTEENGPVSSIKKKSHHTNLNRKKRSTLGSLVNGTNEGKIKKLIFKKSNVFCIDGHDEHPLIHTNGPIQTLVSAGNGPAPSSSPSSSSSSISSSGK
jgi:hypothetical protein